MAAAVAISPAVLAVPTTAEAASTPNVVKLAGDLAKQKLTWETCDFGSDATNERFNLPNVKCATVKVPQDWHDPQNGETWDIRISQAKNQDVKSGRYKGTIFANPGGPGGSGLVWGPAMQERTADLNPYYNYVGFDPRGVGQSSIAECEYSYDSASTDPYAELKAIGAACAKDPQTKTITTEQTAYDMDFIRALLKAPKLSYVGYSYGTWLGTWYENLFGAKYGDKFVLDSSIDGTQATLQKTWDLQPVARDRQFRTHMMGWIARHDDTYGLGENPTAIYDRYFAATENLDPFTILIYWAFLGGTAGFPDNSQYPVSASVVQQLISAGEAASSSTTRRSVEQDPATAADELFAEGEKNSSGETKAEFTAARDKIAPLLQLSADKKSAAGRSALVTGTFSDTFDLIRCNDGQWTQGAKYWESNYDKQADKAPLSAQWGLFDEIPVCAFWRTGNLMPVAAETFPSTIVVQGELDSQTGWEGGYAAGTKLPNTSFIAVDNEGSHGLFPYGTEAVDRPIYDFFLTGKQPKNISVSQALPLPEEDTTYESWAPLNKKAKHVVSENSNPWEEADTAAANRRIAASDVGDDLLAKAVTDAELRQQVQKVYGAEGVKALEENGVL